MGAVRGRKGWEVEWRWIAEAGVRRLVLIVELVIDFEQGGVGDIYWANPVQGRGYASVP